MSSEDLCRLKSSMMWKMALQGSQSCIPIPASCLSLNQKSASAAPPCNTAAPSLRAAAVESFRGAPFSCNMSYITSLSPLSPSFPPTTSCQNSHCTYIAATMQTGATTSLRRSPRVPSLSSNPHSCFPTVTFILLVLVSSSLGMAGENSGGGSCQEVTGDWSSSRVGNVINFGNHKEHGVEYWKGVRDNCNLTVTVKENPEILAQCSVGLARVRFQVTINYNLLQDHVVYWINGDDKCTISSTGPSDTIGSVYAFKI